ncbi:MAG: response regulator transcription factor [Campylobacterales bacterium]
MARILLLEDDPVLSATLLDLLRLEGYAVDLAKNGEKAADLAYKNRYDLYLLDVNVPVMNGFELLSALRRAEDKTPAIFLTALIDTASLAKGFASGAEDYVKKPFDPDELLIRIRARLHAGGERLEYRNIAYDLQSRTITRDGQIVDLGEVARAVLELLLKNAGRNVPKERFYEVLETPGDAALRFHMNRLRQLFSLPIHSVRGVGYRLEKA